MPMMAKMRNLAPAFIIAVGGIFVLFMVISDSRVLQIFGQKPSEIGSVNGEKISYQQFTALMDQARQRQKEQTGKDIDDENTDALNDQVWETLVTQELIKDQIEKFHITVTDQEISDVLFGPNPPEFLRRQFTDSLGRFNRQLYETTLQQQKKEVLLAVEDQVRQMKLQEKLQDYLFASITVSEGELKRRFTDQTEKMSGEYVLIDPNLIPDNQINVTLDDEKAYYEKNIDDYKIDNQRKLKYVLFSKLASKDDSSSIRNNLIALITKAKGDTSSFKSYVDIYSDQPFKKDTAKQSQLPSDAMDAFLNSGFGSIIGPFATFEGYVVYKIDAKIPSKETYYKASHILIPFGSDEKKALAEADAIYKSLNAGADFAQIAKEKSADFSSAKKGGDLGWFGKGKMVKEFEDACANGRIGVVQKPVRTNYGYHIIKVTGKSNTDYVVEKIVNRIKASGTTVENAYTSASDFAYLAGKNSFDSEVKLMNYKVLETTPIKEDAVYIPGIGANKDLIDWTFKEDLNDISEVYKVPSGYVVATISDITKAGVSKFEEVEKSIKPLAIKEKKFEKAKEVSLKIYNQLKNGSLQMNMVNSTFPIAKYDTTGTFAPNQSIPNVGRDFVFNDKVANLPLEKISEPFRGQRGYFIVKVDKRTPFNETTFKMQRNSLRQSMIQEKKNYFFNQWLTQLKKESDIVDNRRLFYR
jgi:peptidyl-prolyl cis-trans isomerase D